MTVNQRDPEPIRRRWSGQALVFRLAECGFAEAAPLAGCRPTTMK